MSYIIHFMILTDTSDLCPEVLHSNRRDEESWRYDISSSWVLQIAGRSIHTLIMEVEEPILERFIPQSSRQRTPTANLQIPMCTSAAWLGNFGTVSCEQFEALAMPVALPVLELWSRTAHACYLLFALSRASGRVKRHGQHLLKAHGKS